MVNDVKRPTSKQRVSRIPLNYHTRPDGFRRTRNRITVVAAVLAIGLVAAIAVSREWHNAGVSPGPVARVHMAWAQKCSVCHESFSPIHEDARLTSSKLGGADSVASIETKCRDCHRTSQHHPHQIAKMEGSCTSCHIEHRGEEVSLTETGDRTCTQCHSQVDRFVDSQFREDLPQDSVSITSFPFQHPEFRSQASDPTKLKFNHQLHLSPGIKISDERRAAWTLADVSADVRARYRRPKAEGEAQDQSDEKSDDMTVVQLDCRDCHVSLADKTAGVGAGADASLIDFKNLPRNQPPLETGAYMLPVKYADHCQGCHPLAVDRPAQGDPQGKSAGHANEIPHGVQGVALRQLLLGQYREQQIDEQPKQKTSRSRIRPLPGESPNRPARPADAAAEQRLRQIETHVREVVCKKCHESGALTEPNAPITVEPVNMPAVWLQKSHFNHRAHRSVKDCQECHDARSSTKTSDVLIEGIAKCRECHTPVTSSRASTSSTATSESAGSVIKAGADFRCVECHRYHRGDLSVFDPEAAHVHGKTERPAAASQEETRASE